MARQDEDFELVLGNKQLLSLFFVVVLFFAAFFSVGYTVGFGHGEENGPPPTLADSGSATETGEDELSFPESLLKDAPELPAAPSAKPSSREASDRAALAISGAAQPTAEKPKEEKPKPTMAKAEPPKTTPAATPKPKPTPKPEPVKTAAPPPADGEYHLQVAALRVPKDAQMLAGTLKDKGYPAAVSTGGGDGWNRVLIGPFKSAEAAKDFRTRLKKDGFDTMLRKQ